MRYLSIAVSAAVLAVAGTAASAQSEAQITIELNNLLEGAAGACRLLLIAENATDTPVAEASYIMAVADSRGSFQQPTAYSFGGVAPGARTFLMFDVEGLSCAEVQEVYVSPSGCLGEDGGSLDICAAFETRTRVDGVELAR